MSRSHPSTGHGALQCARLGEYAVLCDAGLAGDPVSRPDLQQRVWAVSRRLGACADVLEVVPGMNNFLVIFRHMPPDLDAVRRRMEQAWHTIQAGNPDSREVVVPVRYGGAYGPDLDSVARHAGLAPEEYVRRHAAGHYIVYALGSQPGFAYLGGLNPGLAVPRRPSPRPKVEAGAIMIGGSQTGIQSRTTPSGWHVIGKTQLECFDAAQSSPALFAPGDTVRFQVQELHT
ncbi:5-oxoprolinase subunit PxpB [uncultured Castellaniella sp.]|uniref:5-oxoprolinase subunit PxpB n=1 Tax=uncultured Castellaniella sp. TaxID=647907 RepID=UPI00262C9B71|nr:5-oxoprolinase subunit PxpB [uncultured Castellaniella sp.]